MLNKILHFVKYNNAAVIILAMVIILGGSALAAGPEAIGQKQTRVQGVDNTALLSADLDKFSMDFKIERIAEDDKYYYATYSFMDLAAADQVWQYQLSQKTQKVSRKIKQDLGDYLAKFLAKHYEARMRELKKEKNQALAAGEQRRIEVTAYSGLIGRTLNLAAKVFPGYEPVVKREIKSPEFITPPAPFIRGETSGADSLTQVYNDYVAAHPEVISQLDASSTPAQIETTATTTEPILAPEPAPEPASAQVIELPASPAEELTPAPAEPAPAEAAPAEAAPAPAADATPTNDAAPAQ